MYKITVSIHKKGKKEEKMLFEMGEIGSDSYHDEMNNVSDYMYELDIPFDVDMDGDMVIDDILMAISDQEDFKEEIQTKKAVYIIEGSNQ